MTSSRNRVVQLVAGLVVVSFAGGLLMWWRQSPVKEIAPPLQEVPRHDLAQNGGRWYRTGETNAFIGWMVDFYSGGARHSRSQISNGLLNGISETWYTNGQMQVREHFKDGVSSGLRLKFHENGVRQAETMIVDGKVTGIFRSWHDNGQLAEQIEMKQGQPDGVALAYYPSGFLKAETTVRDGQVLGQKSWKDGEHRQVATDAETPAAPKQN